MKISRKDLLRRLANLKGSQIVTLVTLTKEHNLRKNAVDGSGKICPYWENLLKRSHTNGIINFSYQNAVNNQRKREDIPEFFEPEPRVWGERIEKTPLVKHNNQFYIEMMVLNSKFRYETLSGQLIEDDISNFLSAKTHPKTQKTDKPIVLRDYKLDSILEVHMDKNVYQLL